LDGGTNIGAEVSAHFDSLLVKLTCHGRDFGTAVRRARRAIAEFRVRGVATNIAFLQSVLHDPDFEAGNITASFIAQRSQLLTAQRPADRGTKMLNYLADVTVNRPHDERPTAAAY
jgi:pyruvate carboxylase